MHCLNMVLKTVSDSVFYFPDQAENPHRICYNACIFRKSYPRRKGMKPSFSSAQKKLLLTCLTVYTSAYFCRLNLSAALSGIMEAFALSMAQGGMLQTVFAAVYACGQLINGTIVDRVNPARHLLTGIAGTALCNLIMGYSRSYAMLLLVWAASALFQSMMWTPIVRLIAIHVRDDTLRVRAQGVLALTLVLGHFGAWAISGFLAGYVSWRYSFIVPACISLLVFAFASRILQPYGVPSAGRQEKSASGTSGKAESTFGILSSTGFFFIMASCLLYGFVRDGVITWTPTMLGRIGGSSGTSSTAFTLILPVINLIGVTLGFKLRMSGIRPHAVIFIMMVFSALCCAALTGAGHILLVAILLGMVCAAAYGANTMFTALIPIEYDRIGKTGLTAGLIDSFIYLGGAFSGVLGGVIYDHAGAVMLYGSWIFASAAAALAAKAGQKLYDRYFQ